MRARPYVGLAALALLVSCGGPSKRERRVAEAEECRFDPACMVARYGWARAAADSSASAFNLALANARADIERETAARERRRQEETRAYAQEQARLQAEAAATRTAQARRRAQLVAAIRDSVPACVAAAGFTPRRSGDGDTVMVGAQQWIMGYAEDVPRVRAAARACEDRLVERAGLR